MWHGPPTFPGLRQTSLNFTCLAPAGIRVCNLFPVIFVVSRGRTCKASPQVPGMDLAASWSHLCPRAGLATERQNCSPQMQLTEETPLTARSHGPGAAQPPIPPATSWITDCVQCWAGAGGHALPSPVPRNTEPLFSWPPCCPARAGPLPRLV